MLDSIRACSVRASVFQETARGGRQREPSGRLTDVKEGSIRRKARINVVQADRLVDGGVFAKGADQMLSRPIVL